MYIKNTLYVMTLLSALSVIPVWAIGEPAGEVIDMIESDKPVPAKNNAAEKSERIAAARRSAALKKAEEKAAAEKLEKERLTAQKVAEEQKKSEEKAVAEQKEKELLAAQKAAEERKAAAVTAAKNVRPPGNTEQKPSVPEQTAGIPSENSWWGNLTDMVGLTDSDPGVTVHPVSSKTASKSSEYIIGPGDLIGISVWRDENLTKTVVVLPDGKISFPLVGELVAEGKTVAKLKLELDTALSRYTADSNVAVEVKQSNSMIIYVTGRVNTPGRQLMVANTNVLQALSMAGGPNPFAQKSKIKIFRQQGGETVMFPFNYNEVMEGRHLETNIDLQRGDVIIVP